MFGFLLKKSAFLVTLSVFICAAAGAQPSSLGNWWVYFGNKQLDKKWNWSHELQYRNYNVAGDLEQLLVRTGIGYNLSENNNNLLLGYGFIRTEPYIAHTDEKTVVNEHRLFQQFITRQSYPHILVQHRYRVEERFIESNFRMRFRYFLSVNVPINNATLAPKTFYLSAYNEIFLNAKAPVFDRNRLYGAGGYVINKRFRCELGFMRQMLNTDSRNQLQVIFYGNY
ncbi:MAG TPA: DUF2490 domain-containing protein [Flavipsychrobacter sp.]|nr:DUF2490 domain-containing protein [Flavipsychrobacter sp.]